MTYRLFAAIPMPPEIADQLEDLQDGLDDADWRPRENFHLTLRFFGAVDGAMARELDHELARIRMAPFELTLSGVGSFGGDDPHSIWAAANKSPELAALAEGCNRVARQLDIGADRHPFRPHVTLAYLTGFTAESIALWASRFSQFSPDPFLVDHFALYSSRPGKWGAHYVEEAVYPLEWRRS